MVSRFWCQYLSLGVDGDQPQVRVDENLVIACRVMSGTPLQFHANNNVTPTATNILLSTPASVAHCIIATSSQTYPHTSLTLYIHCEAKKLHRFIFAIALSEIHLL